MQQVLDRNRAFPHSETTIPPPGSIVSTFGIRRYHTLPTPIGARNVQTREVDKKRGSQQRANTWPVRDGEEQQPVTTDEQRQEPSVRSVSATTVYRKGDMATQTNVKTPAISAFTQTDVYKQPRETRTLAVDIATSPIHTKPNSARRNINSVNANRSMETEDYQNVLSRHSSDLWDDRRSMSITLSPSNSVGSLPTPFPTRNVVKEQQPTNKRVNMAVQSDNVDVFTQGTQATYPTLPQAYVQVSAVCVQFMLKYSAVHLIQTPGDLPNLF